MTLQQTKLAIWTHRKINRNPIDLQVYADRAKVRLPITQQAEADKLLKLLNKGNKKNLYVPDSSHDRYKAAKLQYETGKFPNWVKDGHHVIPERLKEDTNGLTKFIVNFLEWSHHCADPTENEGRVRKNKYGEQIRIKSTGTKGRQDIDCNLKHSQHFYGINWKIEVKAGKDTHKQHQKDYGKKVGATGAHYSVVRNSVDFLSQYDRLMVGDIKQSSIFV